MATDIETSYSPENISTLVEGINSGRISMSQVPTHVQSELQNRGVDFSDSMGPNTSIEFTGSEMAPTTNVRSTSTKADEYVQGAVLKAYIAGNNVFSQMLDEIGKGLPEDSKSYKNGSAAEYKETVAKDNTEILEQSIGEGVDSEEAYQLTVDVLDVNQETALRDPTRLFLDVVGAPDLDEKVKDQKAGNMLVSQLMQDILDGMGFIDWARNIGGLFVPFKQVYENWDVTGEFFGSQEWVDRFVTGYRQASSEEQALMLESIKENLLPRLPELRQIQFLNALTKPEGAEDLSDWNVGWAALDLAGFAGEIAGGARLGRRIFSVSNDLKNENRAVRVIRDVGNPEQASEIASGAIVTRSEEVLDGTLGGSTSAVNTASPFATEGLDPSSINGLSVGISRRLDEFTKNLEERLKGIADGETTGQQSFISDRQAEVVHDDLLRRYNSHAGIDNVIISRKANKFSIEYDEVDEAGAVVARKTDSYTATLDDVGSFDVETIGFLDRWLNSPLAAWKGTDLEQEARVAQRLDNYQANILNQLRKAHRDALRPILGRGSWKSLTPSGRKKIKELDAVLMKGNLNKEVYTPEQLTSGVLGHVLDDAQIESYYKVRSLMDGLYYLRNSVKRREMQIKGLASIEFTAPGTSVQAGKVLWSPGDAASSIRGSNRKQFFDDETGQYRDLSELDLEAEYSNGKMLVALDEATDVNNQGNKVYYALVDSDSVRELPLEVINYTPGYVPQITQDAVYFGKVRTTIGIDGQQWSADSANANVETVRMFDNKAEADQWAFQENLKLREQGIDAKTKNFIALEDSQLERERAASGMGESIGGTGGLYTGKRSQNEILFGIDGRPREMVNSFEAISRNIASLSKYLPRNEWRVGMERQAINTANRLIGATGSRVFESFEDLKSAGDTDNGKLIKAMYTQIRDWTGMPTSTELLFQDGVRRLVDTSFGQKIPGAKRMLLNVRQKDPVGAARATAFHALLGWFNPVQLWVQAQGLAVAASMNITNPANLLRVTRDQFALQVLQHMEGTASQIKHVAKGFGIDVDYLEGLYTAYKKSGLGDSVLMTADHAAASVGHGITMDALSRAADQGLFFYRAGELLNRRFSFATAYREAFDAAKRSKGFRLDDTMLGTVSDRANNLLLNMSKANRAAWQRGVLSTTFQFNQINQKSIESLLGMNGNFTVAERWKILAGQIGLYGAAGIPLGAMGATWLAEMLGYNTQLELEQNMDPKLVKSINEGFLGLLTYSMLGADLEIGPRSSLLSGVEQIVDDLIFSERTFAEQVFGAFGGISNSFWNELTKVPSAISLGLSLGRPIDIAKAAGNPFIQSISTARNVDKAMFMHRFHRILDKNYNTVIRRDFTPVEEVMSAIGLRLRDEADVYRRDVNVQSNEDYLDWVTQKQLEIYWTVSSMIVKDGTISDEDLEAAAQAMAIYNQGLNNYEFDIVSQRIQDKLLDQDSKENESWEKFRLMQAEGNVNNLMDWSRLFKGNFSQMRNLLQQGGIQQQGIFFDEEGEE